MRAEQKKQAEDGLKLLGKTHKEIRKQMERREFEAAMDLMGQCQQYAMKLGQMIESEEGEGFPTVSLLEDYCERMYQIYQGAGQSQCPFDLHSMDQNLRCLLNRIQNSVRNDVKVHKEAVFLPYKAAMWDSLESVWKAADADPDCRAVVVPIPYYDRNPGGSFREMHYEGDSYPDYVPITHYQEYDFAGRRPDLVFIHNPYDGCNYVTSVHPFFYSKNLKQFTDNLVYIPYFVLEEPDLEDSGVTDDMVGFCICPGVLNADRVFVQSEAMRQRYVNVITESVAGQKYRKKYWENKILGLGSPKMDKILNMGKSALELPGEWKEKIRRPDGSRKKVVLYNTGLNGLLQYEEKMLEKMEWVFRVFQENSQDIVLLFRPHPLLQATMSSMCPRLLKQYLLLVEQYKKESWGIYDDTADVDRAVWLCDAYYGDRSSMVQLCEKAGKPVMLQSMEFMPPMQEAWLEKKALRFENLYDDGENFWFTGFDYNGLFQMNKKSGKAELAGVFPDENFVQGRLYGSMAMCDGKLYFAPISADQIGVYDMAAKEFQKIAMEWSGKKDGSLWKFHKTVVMGERVYFIPYYHSGILCYDTKTERITCFDDWVCEIEKKRINGEGYFVDFVVVENKLILPCTCAPAVVIFDTVAQASEVLPISDIDKLRRYCGICHVGNYFYLVSADGTVSKRTLDLRTEVRKIKLPASPLDEVAFYPVCYMDGYLYLFPVKNSKGVKINIETDQAEEEELLDGENQYKGDGFLFLTSMASDGKLYASAGNSHRFMEYDVCGRKRYETKLFPGKKDQTILETYRKEEFIKKARKSYLTEDMNHSLVYLLEILRTGNDLRKENHGDKELGVGGRIYRTLAQGKHR